MSGHWASAENLFGSTPQAPAYGGAAPTQAMAPSSVPDGWRGLVDPGNPLVWAGAILAITVGFAAAAGSVRVGKGKVAVSVGDTKTG